MIEKILKELAEYPTIQGIFLATVFTIIRMKHAASWAATLTEAVTCGLLTSAAVPLVAWMSWPPAMIVPIGAGIGYLGARKVGDFFNRFFHTRAGQ